MSTTRSSARLAAKIARDLSKKTEEVPTQVPTRKRAIEGEPEGVDARKKSRVKAVTTSSLPLTGGMMEPSTDLDVGTLVPAILTFSLEAAKAHLIGVDRRFAAIFNKLACKPYENLEQFHPFQALSTSILGQQISWLAARSITHKFRRLYDPTLPEKPGDDPAKSFPTPAQVAATDISVLRSAGLSARKAEYIQDLAKRFADGRLSTSKILSANDDDLANMLIQVRGIGRWTGKHNYSVQKDRNPPLTVALAGAVDMFAIFSLRRPDILPTGDLGVQRGLARWYLALHSPSDPFSLSPKKVSQGSTKEKEAKLKQIESEDGDSDVEGDYLPVTGENSSHLKSGEDEDKDVGRPSELPPTFTPSITKTLREPAGADIQALPKTLSVTELRSRISGKKKVKGALLTPDEMEEMTERWKPYRSIGVYYMWSLDGE